MKNRLPKYVLAVDLRGKRGVEEPFYSSIWRNLLTRLDKPAEPFAGGHAGNVLEDAEEGALAGKASGGVSLENYHVGLLTQKPLHVTDTILIDELDKGHAATLLDAVGDIAAVGTKLSCYVGHLQLAVSEKLTLVHHLADALQQFFTPIVGIGFWL